MNMLQNSYPNALPAGEAMLSARERYPNTRDDNQIGWLDMALPALTTLAVLMLFLVSPMVLYQLGLHYEFTGGAAWEKFHPATFVTILAFSTLLVLCRHPVKFLVNMSFMWPGMIAFAAALFFLLFYSIRVQQIPFTPLIDTFLLPIMLFPLVLILREQYGKLLAIALHIIMMSNALIGLCEYLFYWRLTPYVVATTAVETDWRATALLGHPLANAGATGVYVLLVALGGARDLPPLVRYFSLLISLLGLVAFGGRAAMVLAFLVLGIMGTVQIGMWFAGRKISIGMLAASFFLIPLAGAAVVLLAETGFFTRMLERFVSDQGSASTRIAMFNLFKPLSWAEFMLGPNADYLQTLKQVEGLEYGIESFWVAFFLTYGALASTVFFIALFAYCVEVIRATDIRNTIVMIYFFLVASTSVSISAKGTIFAIAIILMLALMRAPDPEEQG